MHLIKNDITRIADVVVDAFCLKHNISPDRLYHVDEALATLPAADRQEYSHALDFGASGWIAGQSQTFLFDHEQIAAFLPAIDRALPPGDYPAPFEFMCIQFSQGIDERAFTSGLRVSGTVEDHDEILGLLIATPESGRFVNVTAWYKSTSLNRVQLEMSGDGEITYQPFDASNPPDNAAQLMADKQRIVNLAMLCLAYIDSPNVEVEHIATPAAVNRRRAARGKRALEDYYVCRVPHTRRQSAGSESDTGRGVSFRFSVRGHFRRLADGRLVWVRPHERGLEHELYRPKVYRVD